MTEARKLYKTKDLYNGERWYNDSMAEMKKQAGQYLDGCGGECILIYMVLNYETGKYRIMTDREVKETGLPR